MRETEHLHETGHLVLSPPSRCARWPMWTEALEQTCKLKNGWARPRGGGGTWEIGPVALFGDEERGHRNRTLRHVTVRTLPCPRSTRINASLRLTPAAARLSPAPCARSRGRATASAAQEGIASSARKDVGGTYMVTEGGRQQTRESDREWTRSRELLRVAARVQPAFMLADLTSARQARGERSGV